MVFQWDKLLCSDTLAEKEKTPSSWVDYPIDPFEQDYREIVSSVSFRHLQDKAQIYELDRGDFVRTRLTHSLEVSTIAKQLGIMLLYNNKWNNISAYSNLSSEQKRSIPTVLACAGLLHDMGNPPYGHEGEATIGLWFADHFKRNDFEFNGTPIRELFNEQMRYDLMNFEGNAQVIRLLGKSRFESDEPEANVSYATLSTLLKYPVSAAEMDKNNSDLRIHKFGYYYSEKELVKEIRERTGMDLENEPHARNPLTYLLEAADDIAYVTADIEDALSKKTVSIHQLVSFLTKKINSLPEEGSEMHQLQVITAEGILNNLNMRLDKCEGQGHIARIAAVHSWTSYVRNWLMYVAATSFVENCEAIMNGTYQDDLLESSYHKYTIKILKSEMYTNVYPNLIDDHLSAFRVIGDYLDRFANAVIYWDTPRGVNHIEENYMALIPKKLKNDYYHEKTDDEKFNLYLRFRMVLDFLGSMTDNASYDLYKRLNAIQ